MTNIRTRDGYYVFDSIIYVPLVESQPRNPVHVESMRTHGIYAHFGKEDREQHAQHQTATATDSISTKDEDS